MKGSTSAISSSEATEDRPHDQAEIELAGIDQIEEPDLGQRIERFGQQPRGYRSG